MCVARDLLVEGFAVRVHPLRQLPGERTGALEQLGERPVGDIPLVESEDRVSALVRPAHVDYARALYLLPRGPGQVELSVEWLLPSAVDPAGVDLDALVALGERVVEQDARMCELNQRGLHCHRHEHGVLVAQEYFVRDFHEWVSARTGAAQR